ncbi:MAG: response regulator, partial [Verrucomicrobia bacterium]
MLFLAVVGWLTAGLIGWGSETAGEGAPRLPWKWFAFFCFLFAADGAIDLARMVTPQVWPSEIEPLVRLAAYGCLLEFGRKLIPVLYRFPVPVAISAGIPTVALAVVFYWPGASPVTETVVAVVAGVVAVAGMVRRIGPGSRSLLGAAAALLMMGVGEILRGRGGDGGHTLYGLFVSGEGFESALYGATLAWVASGSLWWYSVSRHRAAVSAGRVEARSSLASVVLPVLIGTVLVLGYFVVNWRSESVRIDREREFLYRIRAAALAVDRADLEAAIAGRAIDAQTEAFRRVRRQLTDVRGAAEDIMRVYVWRVVDGLLQLPPGWVVNRLPAPVTGGAEAIKAVSPRLLPTAGDPFLVGPIGPPNNTVLLVNVPLLNEARTAQLGWLGAEIAAESLLTAQAATRLQTIALVGLFASLIVFFLAHQILRENEEDLILAKERAEAADRAKDEFLAVMSHEIRTPMQSVLGYSELLARSPLSEAQRQHVDTIRSQGRTLLRVVQDILDFSTLRKASYTLKDEVIFLHRLVQTSFGTIRPLAERKGLRFEMSIEDGVPEVVRGDGVRIEQVLLNLMGNAVKFTDHGSVTLDVAMERDPEMNGGRDNVVRFTISDTGMGIRRADQKRLFEPFIRLSYAEETRREGAGLGLAIVKRLCELMGGRIDLESEWGRGTRFFVRIPLPVVEDADVEASVEGGRHEWQPPGMYNLGAILPLRILVAEDNPYIRRLMIEYLKEIGYQPTAVESGIEAVQRWADFDLILMDLRMPGMDGITAAREIRSVCGDREKPWMIGVSATLSEPEIKRAMEA